MIATLIAAGFAALLLMFQHYALLPYWKQAHRRDMPVLVRYTLGTLALMVPTWGAYLALVEMSALTAILVQAVVTVIGGGAVYLAYALDSLMDWFAQRRDGSR